MQGRLWEVKRGGWPTGRGQARSARDSEPLCLSGAGSRDRAAGLPGLPCGTSGVNRLGRDLGCCPGKLQGLRTCLPGLRSQALGPHAHRTGEGTDGLLEGV